MMESYRKSFPKEIAGAKLLTYIDYQDRIEYDIIKMIESHVEYLDQMY